MFCLCREEMREKNLCALHSNIDILISGVGVFVLFEFKDNLTVSAVYHTGETGDIDTGRVGTLKCQLLLTLPIWV